MYLLFTVQSLWARSEAFVLGLPAPTGWTSVIQVCSLHGLVFLRCHGKLCKAIYTTRVED